MNDTTWQQINIKKRRSTMSKPLILLNVAMAWIWHIGYNHKELLIVSHIWNDLKLDFCCLESTPGGGSLHLVVAAATTAVVSDPRGDILWCCVQGWCCESSGCFFVPVKMSEVGQHQRGPHCSRYTGSHRSVRVIPLRVKHWKRKYVLTSFWQCESVFEIMNLKFR